MQLTDVQKKIEAGEFSEALEYLSEIINSDNSNPEAFYMQAVCHRYRKEYELSLEALNNLKALSPDHGRAHQEEGHTYRDMGNFGSALRAYERACYFNPALISSYKSQIKILKAQGRSVQLARVSAQLKHTESLPKPLLAVVDLISQGKLLKAEELCRKFMLKMPHHVEGMRLLADIGIRLGVLDDAEYLLETAVELEPENTRARIDYIQALRKRQRYELAFQQAQNLLQSEPDNHQFKSIYAVECMQTGNFDGALQAFDEILVSLPSDPVTLTSKGHALKTRGDFDEAVSSYHLAIDSNFGHGEAYYSLANLKTYRFSETEISNMESLATDNNLPFMDRVYIYFALGKAYEDEQDYARSFNHYEQGNKLKKTQSRYRAEQMSEEFAAQKEIFTKDFIESMRSSGHPAPDPIFILGLPRAGSTLLEQILSSHSQVDGTLELPNILSLSQKLRRMGVEQETPGYPQILPKLPPETYAEFGQEFIKDTQIHRAGAPFFIDKMPNNFRHIGLIKLMLPNAKVIDARRNPLDCCLSGYKQLFAEGQEFTYDLQDIGQYYRDYVSLMEFWDKVLPGFVLRVNNEDVIDDLETQVRRMLDFCGLPFEEACLNFHQTERNIRTPSAEQVRKPVSRAGVGQWRHYDQYLDPLKEVLGSELTSHSLRA